MQRLPHIDKSLGGDLKALEISSSRRPLEIHLTTGEEDEGAELEIGSSLNHDIISSG